MYKKFSSFIEKHKDVYKYMIKKWQKEKAFASYYEKSHSQSANVFRNKTRVGNARLHFSLEEYQSQNSIGSIQSEMHKKIDDCIV